MSIAVAVRKDARIVLATDSQTNLGSERVPTSNLSGPKFMPIGDAHLAATGWTLYSNILADVLGRRRTAPRLDDEASIFKFFTRLWGELHERYNFVKGPGRRRGFPVRKPGQHVYRGVRQGNLRCRLRSLGSALRALLRHRVRCADRAGSGACLVRVGARRRRDCTQRRTGRDRPRRVLRSSGACRDGARACRTNATAEQPSGLIRSRSPALRKHRGCDAVSAVAWRPWRSERNTGRAGSLRYITPWNRSITVATTLSGSSRHQRWERISTSWRPP